MRLPLAVRQQRDSSADPAIAMKCSCYRRHSHLQPARPLSCNFLGPPRGTMKQLATDITWCRAERVRLFQRLPGHVKVCQLWLGVGEPWAGLPSNQRMDPSRSTAIGRVWSQCESVGSWTVRRLRPSAPPFLFFLPQLAEAEVQGGREGGGGGKKKKRRQI